ncbi:unnamed protein product [Ixodes persulcatus]
MLQIKPNPSPPDTIEFLDSICGAINNCSGGDDSVQFKSLDECLHKYLWSMWEKKNVMPMKDMKLIEQAMECMIPVTPTAKVGKHILVYGKKIAG